MIIVGAGLAGLLAAHAWPAAPVFEAAPGPSASHKALLRFRSDAVARLTGIEFRPVMVRKGIWYNERYVAPDIQLANLYAQKVVGALEGERSIWQLDPVTRFIAPETFYEQLIGTVGVRVRWNHTVDFRTDALTQRSFHTVNTAPLPIVCKALGIEGVEFRRAPIRVVRYRVAQCDVFQTCYIPAPAIAAYRASITGSLLIVESVVRPEYSSHPKSEPRNEFDDKMNLQQACHAFALDPGAVQLVDAVSQQFGKIIPLESDTRKSLLFKLTNEFGIYSLGRFATWRNVLLDDVVKDIDVVRKLLKSSAYDSALIQKGQL